MTPPVDRRTFLKSAVTGLAAAALGPVSIESSLAASNRDHAGAAGTIIDTHTHFYDPTRPQGVPWPDKSEKRLYRRVRPEDYRALPQPQPVRGTVVVEASSWIEDNAWILELAARDPFIVGFVGHLEPGTDAFRGHLKRFAANRLFRGIRVGGDQLTPGLDQPQFVADLKALAAHDLELDVNGPPTTLPDVARLAAKIPELRMVINHVANLRVDGQAPPNDWLQGMRAAAKHRHVFCKVSGLVEGSGHSDGTAPRDVEFYRPVLDAIWDAFGEDRLVYGSNWPVSELFASLATVQGIVHAYFSAKGKSAEEKVFGKNARAAYKWLNRRTPA
ncbi:MAG: amidohydrolase family protein [Limisphaerales bacterium]